MGWSSSIYLCSGKYDLPGRVDILVSHVGEVYVLNRRYILRDFGLSGICYFLCLEILNCLSRWVIYIHL